MTKAEEHQVEVEKVLKTKSAYMTVNVVYSKLKDLMTKRMVRDALTNLCFKDRLDVIQLFDGANIVKAYLHEDAIFD